MNGIASAEFIEWDVTNWSVALKFWESNTRLRLETAKVLEIGSRNGGLTLWAALKGMQVLCTDLAGPTEAAIAKHKRYGVASRVEYGALDAANLPYREKFEAVMFKSVLGGIGCSLGLTGQAMVIRQIHEALKPGGELWFAENLTASPLHQRLRRRFVRWGQAWRYVSVPEMQRFLEPFAEVRYETLGFLGALGCAAWQRSVLGKIDRAFVDRLVPDSWHYIIVGVARK